MLESNAIQSRRRDVMQRKKYGLFVQTSKPYPEALDAVKTALRSEGFGVLTEINVQETLKQKLGVDFRRYDSLALVIRP
jgi:uncharacterized protein (DUF302 family)